MELVLYPDKALRRKTVAFEESEMAEARRIAHEMVKLMYRKKGIGLAAPQVGISRKLFVMDVSENRDSPVIIINPKIQALEGVQVNEEGCLSLPGLYAEVKRAAFARVSYLDAQGVPTAIEGEGLLARVLQHEFDHLEAMLFIDRLTTAQRLAIRGELREMERSAKSAR
jgi:peptide deformylase